jgi:histidinol-phosphate/aromatic aminotransferase/cobyric acid decarboxylase-like protein
MAPVHISRRDLLQRGAFGAALAAVVPSLVEGAFAGGPADTRPNVRSGQPHFPIRLTSNQNPYGPSRRVTAVTEAATRAGHLDPERESEALREQIATHHGVARDEVVLTGGSSKILRMAVVESGLFARSRGDAVTL